MKRLIASSLIVLLSAATVRAGEVLREVSWKGLQEAGQPSVGSIEATKGPGFHEALRINNPEQKSKTVTFCVLNEPQITTSRYALSGQIRYEGVEGQSYLEMWNHFPDGGKYFTRTLASSGLLKSLHGSSTWRPFSLPFYINNTDDRPTKLVVNLVMAGRGTVHLSPLTLTQYSSNENPMAVAGQWWDSRTAGLLGGIAGGILGCLGALIGVLSGMGKARGFVMLLVNLIVYVGLVILAAGVVALVRSQPYAVYYPLLLIGGLAVVIMRPTRNTLRRRYEQLELRKMDAMDAGIADSA